MSIQAQVSIAHKLGFTSHQNAVPLLRELILHNESEQTFQDLTLHLRTAPAVLEAKQWNIDRLLPGSSLDIRERDVKLNAEWLAELTESVQCEVTLSLKQGDEELFSLNYPLEALAKNEWGGSAMCELLPSFIMPNDPAVDRLLKATSDVLRGAGKNDALDGYDSQSRTRVWEIASALWTAVCNLNISYALPPASFERNGQKIRTPGAILEGKVATCLDTTLLFSSALEQMGLNALVLLSEGHAFAGFWLQPQEFAQLVTEDVSSVRKRIDLKEIVVFETTLVTKAHPPSFTQSFEEALKHLTEEEFHVAIDCRRARMQKIRPLTLSITHLSDQSGSKPDVLHGFEDAPLLPSFELDTEIDSEKEAASRLVQWQRKLLDLTTRNRLLHLPESAKAVRLICPNPGSLEDKLAEGKRIRITSLPDLESGGRDTELYRQRTNENIQEQYAQQALDRGEVVSPLDKERLESALIDLYRKSKSDLEEGGANTLFLAVGFLKWKKSAEDPKHYSAPLILLPVQLDRKSALSGVTMRLLEEEPRFNLTLLELLHNDFALTINGLGGELPTDESGIDVDGIWNMVRRAVRDIAGFEVTRDVVIGTFSFAKYLMWKDLIDRAPQLMESSLVKYLIERGQENVAPEKCGEIVEVDKLDDVVNTPDLFLPLPADSSQVAAVVASANGRDFVLDGPPGTGKSQTIANMIAHNLALGKRVLFVAEKKAALDVVYRRLEAQGLGEFCLELHSSKTSKIDFLKQLERAWDTRDMLTTDEWEEEAGKVQRLRGRLNEVVRLLHKRWPNGMSLHQAMGRVIRDASALTPQFSWAAGSLHNSEQMTEFRDIAKRLELNRGAFKQYGAHFNAINQTEWTNGWQSSLVAEAHSIPGKIEHLENAARQLYDATGITQDSTEPDMLMQLISLCELLSKTAGLDMSFVFVPDMAARIDAAKTGIILLNEIELTKAQLSVDYPENSWLNINIQQIKNGLEEADKKFWFFATNARKKVTGEVVRQCLLSATPELSVDLPVIDKLQSLHQKLSALSVLIATLPGWNALDTDPFALQNTLNLADAIRSALAGFASSPQGLAAINSAVKILVVDANDLLNSQGIIASLTQKLRASVADFSEVKAKFSTLTNVPESELKIPVLRDCASGIVCNQSALKAWSDWCRVSEEAINRGLLPLVNVVTRLDANDLDAVELFETGYCRWFASWVIDSEALLYNFVPVEHMSDIEAYRLQTDRLASLTVRYIRAKLCGVIPAKNEINKQGGFALLKHELQKSRRHKPVRQMAAEMGDAMSKLAPCMLMSPLSVAQFLPSKQALFDLVIFDEASQISPWDAIGAMARGKQVVIAGDPRQMPPTSFFNRGASDSDDDTESDMESILDECLAAGLYNHSLSWHYRSRHESLITFSNHRYYDSNLITFPAPETKQSAVQWRKVEGVYSKGNGRHNQAEAEAMVAETVKRLTDKSFIASGKSIGIITLNTEQQRLISDLLDRARQQHPEIEPFFQSELEEPVVVKNLETVQGDERDLIMLGIGYGPTEPGANTMSMNFGPLNREGGWRRLNVAVTRARQEMIVFSSFEPSFIDLNRTSARAVADLKHFIEFAQRGPVALAQAVHRAGGDYDSPFEEAVANGLRRKGWQVVSQIGVSRFRIDLGIVHPDKPGDYLVGVECDGATYHSAATARDRDKVRSAILQGLGWKLLRLWSTEWWVDKEGALERLDMAINALLEGSRMAEASIAETEEQTLLDTEDDDCAEVSAGQVSTLAANGEGSSPLVESIKPEIYSPVGEDETENSSSELKHTCLVQPKTVQPTNAGQYTVNELKEWLEKIDSDKFYGTEYDETLKALIADVVEVESPLLETELVQRIARVHGFSRAGRLIRERVMEIVDQNYHVAVDHSGDNFVWLSEVQKTDWTSFRLPASDNDIRQVDAIPCEELRALALNIDSENKISEMARALGIKRLTSQARQRLESVL
jgi:very-short-patch-repair endonuclease